MTVTDIIIFLISVVLLLRGYMRGLLQSILGPLSTIVATIISVIYYQSTHDIVISLVIGLLGPFILFVVLKLFFKTDDEKEQNLNYLSRAGGALLTLLWGGVFITFILIALELFPPLTDTLRHMHEDIDHSASFSLVKPLEKTFFGISDETPSSNNANPSSAGSNTAQDLANDPRFKAVFADPEVQREIQERDFAKLMSNPKVLHLTQELMNDPAALQKVMAIYRNQMQSNQATPSSK